MYTILGMELFSNTLRFDLDGIPIPPFGDHENTSINNSVPNWNFNNFLSATLAVFVVLANDGWTVIYFDHFRVNGGFTSSVYFLSLIIIGQFVLFNLFLSILLKEFGENNCMDDGPQFEDFKTEDGEVEKSKCAKIFYCKVQDNKDDAK
jgi:hypothetical protein